MFGTVINNNNSNRKPNAPNRQPNAPNKQPIAPMMQPNKIRSYVPPNSKISFDTMVKRTMNNPNKLTVGMNNKSAKTIVTTNNKSAMKNSINMMMTNRINNKSTMKKLIGINNKSNKIKHSYPRFGELTLHLKNTTVGNLRKITIKTLAQYGDGPNPPKIHKSFQLPNGLTNKQKSHILLAIVKKLNNIAFNKITEAAQISKKNTQIVVKPPESPVTVKIDMTKSHKPVQIMKPRRTVSREMYNS